MPSEQMSSCCLACFLSGPQSGRHYSSVYGKPSPSILTLGKPFLIFQGHVDQGRIDRGRVAYDHFCHGYFGQSHAEQILGRSVPEMPDSSLANQADF